MTTPKKGGYSGGRPASEMRPPDRATYPKWEGYAYTAVKLCEDELRAALASVGRTEPEGVGILNCPVCGSGEEGDCICLAAEAIAKAEWERSGRAVYEAPWGQVSDIKRHSLIVKALPAAHEARRTEPAPEAGS